MKEIRDILERIAKSPIGQMAVLATVVDLEGSGYRRPGARMLIEGSGYSTGTVSGGCLEADVLERAKRVLNTKLPELFTYDTSAEENSVFSLNMGCRGVLKILLEPVDRLSPVVESMTEASESRRPLASAVVIRVDGSTNLKVGDRFSLKEPGKLLNLENIETNLRTFAESDSLYETIIFNIADAFVEVAFEKIFPPTRLLIFGAGADAVPLSEIAHLLGWQIDLFDHRPAFLTHDRFPVADNLHAMARDSEPTLAADDRTAIVLMNHNYERDKAMLAAALRSDAFYVGALGPKKRTQQILDELARESFSFDERQLSRLRSPAGLDIGGDSPETIAVSIIAEIQTVLKRRNGGPLRDRSAPIYDR